MRIAAELTEMGGDRLLDTNIVIALFFGDLKVREEIMEFNIYVPSIVIGELRYGAEKSTRRISNQVQIDSLVNEVHILPVTANTAGHYGIIKNSLKKRGQPIPENDVWIAALSRELDMVLVTRDNHFSHIDDIQIEVW